MWASAPAFLPTGPQEASAGEVLLLTGVIVAIGINATYAFQFPRGIVGYEAVGRCLASLDKPGNVLLCCWEDQDLIFRLSAAPHSSRAMLCGDRLLAVRLPEYAKVEAIALVKDEEELLDVIRRGRARYIVTSLSTDEGHNDRFPEIRLTHRIAAAASSRFRLMGKFPILFQYGGPGWHADVYVWEYLGDLRPVPANWTFASPPPT